MQIYNTLHRTKEIFEPLTPNQVNMYVCGPTVYDFCHIGHARSVVVFDVVARYFRDKGYTVNYVRNFTDVDDKIIQRAREMEMTPAEVAERYIAEFYNDMDALNVERASVEPRATDYIESMIEFIQRLIQRRLAYDIDGDVYYAVDRFQGYGKLSARNLEEMEAGARVDVNVRKKNPHDFALWKAAKPGEPWWESPWGRGRPGWHIECSAMSSALLGETFDIHGGGKDLIFPHHENEIAQSEGLSQKPFARYWMHNGFVNIDKEKMSKSLGNFLMIKDVLKQHHPEAVRLFLLSNHYRSPIDFNEKAMADAGSALDKLYGLLQRIEEIVGPKKPINETQTGPLWQRFVEAMDDDFNTARAIGILFEEVRSLNRRLDDQASAPETELERILCERRMDMLRMGTILGIFSQSPRAFFELRKQLALDNVAVDPEEIEQLVARRTRARSEKDWKKADEIREKLEALNVILKDRPDGTSWKIKA